MLFKLEMSPSENQTRNLVSVKRRHKILHGYTLAITVHIISCQCATLVPYSPPRQINIPKNQADNQTLTFICLFFHSNPFQPFQSFFTFQVISFFVTFLQFFFPFKTLSTYFFFVNKNLS